MKTLDDLFAEIARRNLYVSNLFEALGGDLRTHFRCALKHRDAGAYHSHAAPTLQEAVAGALALFGPERKAKAVDEFEDLLG